MSKSDYKKFDKQRFIYLCRKYLPEGIVKSISESRRKRIIKKWVRKTDNTSELDESVLSPEFAAGLLVAWSNPQWAASVEYLMAITNSVMSTQGKPVTVLECGSGATTLMLNVIAKRYSGLSVLSVEHDFQWFKKMENILKGKDRKVSIVNAPLVNYERGRWYDVRTIVPKLKGDIDLVVCDGPPRSCGDRALLVPVMKAFLSDRVQILLDDVNRQIEKEALFLWQEKFGFEFNIVNCSKPYAVVQYYDSR